MSLILVANSKKGLKGKALVEWYFTNSLIKLTKSSDNINPDWCEIELHGEISRIPAMKNNKSNKGFIHPDFIARIKAMDLCWQRDIKQNLYYGDEKLSGVLFCASRGRRSFDADNCATTVKDWLEPRNKQAGRTKKQRGWGIGIVNNDTNLQLLPIKADAFCRAEAKASILLICKADLVRESLACYIASHYASTVREVIEQ